MKKILLPLIVSVLSLSSINAHATQTPNDSDKAAKKAIQTVKSEVDTGILIDILIELKFMRSELTKLQAKEKGNSNPTCTDGEKTYSIGMVIKGMNHNLRCDLRRGHTEWVDARIL
ncbi:hypothetical protein [Xenorhabdus ishibashii]|uniref:Periplasmic protein n=1 Tax=Xenorhabdus ishibashii TaxID=1034471 RepID=A0A2D0K8G9_9GAMM|nr:hypothetical protein [Xenorhabdus ishibashii]PHM59507.1 hypothetical protein Xish_03625 [Xenorhabdus ishibashii]